MTKKIFAFFFILSVVVLPLATQAAPFNNNSANGASSLINQMVEQNFADPNIVFGPAFAQLLEGSSAVGRGNETYQGIKQFWHDDLVGNVFKGIGQTISNWFNRTLVGHLVATISALGSAVKSFFLNPNLLQIASNSNNHNDLSFALTQLANIIYGIAVDLLFLLFIVAIWHYWTKASWQGNISAMSAVGRLICTIGIILGWPALYSLEIELSNEMISAIFINSSDQLRLLDMVLANTFNISLYAGTSKVITQLIPAANLEALGIASLGGFLSSLAVIIVCILAIVLIYELIYLIVLKAIQMALLTAQYVFAPVFLIFFATPSTEKIAVGYIRTFIETSVWSFIWIGLLKILVILMYANFNPCGKILTAIGILQLMMRVPQFLGHFKISAASDFVNPAFFTSGLREKATTYAEAAKSYKDQFVSTFSNFFRGAAASQTYGGSSNHSSADFSFGNAGGNVVQLPNSNRYKSGYHNDGYMDYQHEKNHPTSTNGSVPPFVDKPPSSQPSVNKNINNGELPKTHTSFGVHARRTLSENKDIFARHNKMGCRGNVIDLPTARQAPYEVPAAAIALLDTNSLSGVRPSDSNICSDNPFNTSSFCSFARTPLPGILLSKFDLPIPVSNPLANKSNIADSRLLAAHLASLQLAYGSGSALVGRQQFALPSFTGSAKTTSGSDIEAVHPEPDNQQNMAGKSVSNEYIAKGIPTNLQNRKVDNRNSSYDQNNNRHNQDGGSIQYINHHNRALYYPSSLYPGWQRPYRPNFRIGCPVNTERRFSFYSGINYPAVPCFRSYYS